MTIKFKMLDLITEFNFITEIIQLYLQENLFNPIESCKMQMIIIDLKRQFLHYWGKYVLEKDQNINILQDISVNYKIQMNIGTKFFQNK